MHADIFALFDHICHRRRCGGDVLEIGAMPSEDTLLCLPSLAVARRRVGVNIAAPSSIQGFKIHQGHAHDLRMHDGFGDESFDTVLCNSVLEHDPHFWKTLKEMRRLLRPGGVIGIGVPGFATLPIQRQVSRVTRVLSSLGVPSRLLDPWQASTQTLTVHNYPGDYYRFSPQAVAEVFLEGFVATEVHTVMVPPRIIGFGVKPAE
jgi:SAM-dependent methyltransferase